MWTTKPLAVTHDEIWIFVHYSDTNQVDACRMAVDSGGRDYVLFPTDEFPTDAVMPTCEHGDAYFGLRWATTSDLTTSPLSPGDPS